MTKIQSLDWRGLSASIASVLAALGLVLTIGREAYMVAVALAFLALAAIAIHGRALGPQIFARAVWWANLALGVTLSVAGGGRERNGGTLMAIACGAALLLASKQRLAAATSSAGYAPVALRSMLLLLMVFALADAQTFLLFGSLPLISDSADKFDHPYTMLAIGAVYTVGFVGLYRLQLWGSIVNIAMSFAVLVMLFATTALVTDSVLRTMLAVLATVHLVTATPVTIAAIRGSQLPGLSPRLRNIIATAATAALMLLSVCSWLLRG